MRLVEYVDKKTVVTWLVDDEENPQRVALNYKGRPGYRESKMRDKFVSKYGENVIKNCQPVFVADIAFVDTTGSQNRDGFRVLDVDTGETYEMRIEEALTVLNNCNTTGKKCTYISDLEHRLNKDPRECRVYRVLVTFVKIGSNGIFMSTVNNGAVPDQLPDRPVPFPEFFK